VREETKIKKRSFLIISIISLLCISSFGFCTTSFTLNKNLDIKSISTNLYGDLYVYFIDVGQGDCILIQSPDSKFVLIDTGSQTYAPVVIDFLNEHYVYCLTAFIATHPHEDHIGGCQEIFDAFEIESVYHPGYNQDSATYQRFLTSAENEGCPVYTDDEIDPGDFISISNYLSCQVLSINKDASNANDASIILRLNYNFISFLFTGDINGDSGDFVEQKITDNYDVDIDILKVAHHGSRHATTEYFLMEATPEVSIISCGRGNSYGHPHYETLSRLKQYYSDIYRTDENGNIAVRSDGFSYYIFYDYPNESPYTPTISGMEYGSKNYEYMYEAEAIDPNNDWVYYMWDWNDGNVTDWKGPYAPGYKAYEYHSWSEDGTYIIKVKAKDINGQESSWGYLNVVMPKEKINPINFFSKFFRIMQKIKFLN